MPRFNTLLREAGLDPARVQLVRHQDTRFRGRPTPYSLWLAQDGRFETYQAIQRPGTFRVGWVTASFVKTFAGETLFAGVYQVGAAGPLPPDVHCPIAGPDDPKEGSLLHQVTRRPELAELEGRLFIDWGPGTRSWVQLAGNQDKGVLEIRASRSEPPFPGFREFVLDLQELEAIPESWKTALRSVGGIYLLTCRRTGDLYVGAAYGAEGFFGRWRQYAADGHGGNVLLRAGLRREFQVSVLEVVGQATKPEDTGAAEQLWMRKLRPQLNGQSGLSVTSGP